MHRSEAYLTSSGISRVPCTGSKNPCCLLQDAFRALQVDPSVSAQVHFVSSLYYKHKQEFADFYKASLQYLAFISSDSLPTDTRLVSTQRLRVTSTS